MCFNTSHVVVYLVTPHFFLKLTSVSIHLMLQFIQYPEYRFRSLPGFQYISCCSLSLFATAVFPLLNVSIHLMLQFILTIAKLPYKLASFNTSHVVVYLSGTQEVRRWRKVSIHLMLQFIRSDKHHSHCKSSFNTSHVVVYREWDKLGRPRKMCFNTSHVVVYQFRRGQKEQIPEFQYISCCSLSPYPKGIYCGLYMFQYISCCSLSSSQKQKKRAKNCFNTSHVVVYLSSCC